MSRERIELMDFPVKRPERVFDFDYDLKLDSDSWFETHRYAILKSLMATADDLRVMRGLGAQMLGEAWNEEKFMAEERRHGADSVDRLYLIVWLQHWLTFLGLLEASDINTIRFLGENGREDMANTYFSDLFKKKHKIVPFEAISQETRNLSGSGKLVGVFLGSFDPPTFMHLSLAKYYRQYCNALVIGIDSDELVRKRKGPDRPRYPFLDRYSVWASFANVADYVTGLPEDIFEAGKFRQKGMIEYYRELGAGIVFFSGLEPGRVSRISHIRKAGAIPFDRDPYQQTQKTRFSSTDLMGKIRSGMADHILGRKP